MVGDKKKMTVAEVAAMLNGREIMKEVSRDEENIFATSGIVVVYGYSDDGVILVGAIHEHLSAWNGTVVKLSPDGFIRNECSNDDCPYHKKKLAEATAEIKVDWDSNGYSWYIHTDDIPFEPFDILEDGEKFCRGIVFDINSIPKG